jgi:transcriptional/translational regulatory protein YebC/TACO1
MPENVERAIKKATDNTADYKAVLFEGYASWDCLLIETATDNNNRTVANVRSYFNKCNGTLERRVQLNLCLTIPATSAFQQTVLTLKN